MDGGELATDRKSVSSVLSGSSLIPLDPTCKQGYNSMNNLLSKWDEPPRMEAMAPLVR